MIHKEEIDMWKSRYDRVVSTLARREKAAKELENQIDELEKYSKNLPNTSSEVLQYTMNTIRSMEEQNATID
jgi:predicted  nucleic acid-binding Zn-ribbon protein